MAKIVELWRRLFCRRVKIGPHMLFLGWSGFYRFTGSGPGKSESERKRQAWFGRNFGGGGRSGEIRAGRPGGRASSGPGDRLRQFHLDEGQPWFRDHPRLDQGRYPPELRRDQAVLGWHASKEEGDPYWGQYPPSFGA